MTGLIQEIFVYHEFWWGGANNNPANQLHQEICESKTSWN